MKILVTRDTGEKIAPDTIVDGLCVTQAVCTERGKAFLYDNGFDKREYTVSFPYMGEIYPTQLILVMDSELGESFIARVVSHSISVTTSEGALSIISTVEIERSLV